jgi:hypothetical protein
VFKVFLSNFSEMKLQNLEILSPDGKLLYQTKLLKPETEINTGNIKPGFYFVKVSSDKWVQAKKILIL